MIYFASRGRSLKCLVQFLPPQVLSGGSDAAWGAALARGAEGLFGTSNLGAKPDTESAPPPAVVFAVQPGEGGPLEDWLNLERCVPKDGGLLVSLNGAFDKLRGGYYPRLLFPKLADCVDRRGTSSLVEERPFLDARRGD